MIVQFYGLRMDFFVCSHFNRRPNTFQFEFRIISGISVCEFFMSDAFSFAPVVAFLQCLRWINAIWMTESIRNNLKCLVKSISDFTQNRIGLLKLLRSGDKTFLSWKQKIIQARVSFVCSRTLVIECPNLELKWPRAS